MYLLILIVIIIIAMVSALYLRVYDDGPKKVTTPKMTATPKMMMPIFKPEDLQYDIYPLMEKEEEDVNIDEELDLDMNLDDMDSMYAAGAAPKQVKSVAKSVEKLKTKLPEKQVDQLKKNVKELKLTQPQMDNYVKNYAVEYQLSKKLDTRKDKSDANIKVDGKKVSITSDVVARLKKDNRDIDSRSIAQAAGKFFQGKAGDLTKTQYNNLLKSFVNLNYYNQAAKSEEPNVAKKKSSDFRFDVNKQLKSNNMKLSDSASSKIRTEVAKNLRSLNINNLPKDVYNNFLNKVTKAYSTVLTKVDNRIDKAVQTLNKENSSGDLPKDSNYRDLKSNGLIYFDDKAKSWKETQKAKEMGKLTVNNNAVTSNKIYNDVSNYIGTKYPNLSKDKKFVNFIVNSAISLGNKINGNLSDNNYQQFVNNYVDSKILTKPYLASAVKPDQIEKDIKQTMSNYFNTDSINPKAVERIAGYVKKLDLANMNYQEYDNLLNGLSKGYGLGTNTLSPTGQGLNGRLTIDNKNASPAKLQSDIIQVLKNSPEYTTKSPTELVAEAKNIATYLNTKGGNVDSGEYDDLLTGLVRGYGMGKFNYEYV